MPSSRIEAIGRLVAQVRTLEPQLGARIRKRLASFRRVRQEEWFTELCFCLLTANAKARTAFEIQKALGTQGFRRCSVRELSDCIRSHKHRFHNNKARFIVEARRHDLTQLAAIKDEAKAREWLVHNVKGMGYKEASHFLRNIGCTGLAIIDRHVLSILEEYGIHKRPKTMTPKTYLAIENILALIAKKLDMTQAELDMYLWYMRTRDVLK